MVYVSGIVDGKFSLAFIQGKVKVDLCRKLAR